MVEQFPPFDQDDRSENLDFLTSQLITYIGNKRGLLDFIGQGVEQVKSELGREKLAVFDVFSGSGVVARYLKRAAGRLIVNDLERYSEITNQCYLANRSSIDHDHLRRHYDEVVRRLQTEPLREGLISELYAPRDSSRIQMGERVFYTPRNARYIDTARQLIAEVPPEYQVYLLAPLLAAASVHANTSGVFKGFYKDSRSGIGQFGGNSKDSLKRIMGEITLAYPVFSNFECELQIHRGDSNQVIRAVDEVDLAYIDPPYNQHPYGSNYFMLNLIAEYLRPEEISKVSGIPANWNRSQYNRAGLALATFRDLVENIRARYLLISFNSEGFITNDQMLKLLASIGEVSVLETKYNAFRGSRNLHGRGIHVKEYLYLVRK